MYRARDTREPAIGWGDRWGDLYLALLRRWVVSYKRMVAVKWLESEMRHTGCSWVFS